jgi:hypothetical protein
VFQESTRPVTAATSPGPRAAERTQSENAAPRLAAGANIAAAQRPKATSHGSWRVERRSTQAGRIAAEPRQRGLIGRHLLGEELERDAVAQASVRRLDDEPHAAATDDALDAVFARDDRARLHTGPSYHLRR